MPRNLNPRQRDPAREEARRARRRNLLEAADLVIRRRGPGVSMSEIAAEAGVTKPILYKHFGDKGGLYQALAERYLQTLLGRLRATLEAVDQPRERITQTIATYLEFIETENEIYGFLMHRAMSERPEAQATVADFIRSLGDEIAVILGDELRRNKIDSGGAEAWAHGMVGMVYIAGDRWLRHPTMSRAALVDQLSTLLWLGFSGLPAIGETSAGEERPDRRLLG
jgi:AcrR family transcriptional regulator